MVCLVGVVTASTRRQISAITAWYCGPSYDRPGPRVLVWSEQDVQDLINGRRARPDTGRPASAPPTGSDPTRHVGKFQTLWAWLRDQPGDELPTRFSDLEEAHRHAVAAILSQPVWQTLAQFLAGACDLDLRDCTGSGHGAMVPAHAAAGTAQTWRRRLRAGDLVGIAATERHGGSRIREITTQAASAAAGSGG